MKRFTAIMILMAALTACGLENPIVNAITHDDSKRLPDVQDTVIHGIVTAGSANIKAAAGGQVLAGIECTAASNGDFKLHFPGTESFQGLILSATGDFGQYLDMVPFIPRQGSVFNGEVVLPLPRLNPAYPQLDINSTAATLLLQTRAIMDKKTINSLSVTAIAQAMADIRNLAGTVAEVRDFYGYVAQIMQKYQAGMEQPFALNLQRNTHVSDLLSQAFVDAAGQAGMKQEFSQKAMAAAKKFHFKVCYSKKEITVVFMVKLSDKAKDLNCQAVKPFTWAKQEPGKTVYFTGGVHKTTPVCQGSRKTACITAKQLDSINAKLGNWVPNRIKMYDDGTHGDAKAGDSVFTITFVLPYIPLDTSPDHRGLRIGYKYTYGHGGQGWTDSEEWPGNQRILELEDVNGDGVVTRFDIFGDETSNKDKANALTPANGGCGVNLWETDKRAGCAHDTWENRIDTNGDCKPDAWPDPGNATPITVPCK